MSSQLSAQDAQFLYLQNGDNLTHIMAVYIYDPSTASSGVVRFKDIIEHVHQRLNISPLLRRKLFRLPFDLDHPYWVEDEHFDLESHISHSRLPEPADWRQFCIYVARHHSKPMNMNRPLWDMSVVEGLDNISGYAKGSYAILIRIHHAAVDGASMVHFLSALSDIDAKGTPIIPLSKDEIKYEQLPTKTEIMNRALTSAITSPLKLTQALARYTPALFGGAQQSIMGENNDKDKAPETRFNGNVSPHKVFDALTFSLDDMKKIRLKVPQSTLNDVVLAISSGALRRYLEKHGELPDKSLVAVVPVNARTQAGQDVDPGTNISAMTVKLWTGISDPLERLAAIRNTTCDTKAGKSGLSARIITDFSKAIPGMTLSGIARIMNSERFAQKISNVFISNVPGAQIPLYMNGAKMTHQYGLGPLGNGMGLFIATPSYNGSMSFSVVSDRKIMPDVDFFRECLSDAFSALLSAPIKKGLNRPTKIKKRSKSKAVIQDASVMYRKVAKTRRTKQL